MEHDLVCIDPNTGGVTCNSHIECARYSNCFLCPHFKLMRDRLMAYQQDEHGSGEEEDDETYDVNCPLCGGTPIVETYGVVYQDSSMQRRQAYGMGRYCPHCGTFQLFENLNDTRLERAGNND